MLPGEIKRAESNGGYASIGNRDGYNWVWENTVNYTNTFEKHTISALVGMTAQAFVSENSAVSTADFTDGFFRIQLNTIRSVASSCKFGYLRMADVILFGSCEL
ncbi:hypothetical protein NXX23_22340 [Bacteroides ovatus]|nr:hypothetical protein [Bacteroides ovatus]